MLIAQLSAAKTYVFPNLLHRKTSGMLLRNHRAAAFVPLRITLVNRALEANAFGTSCRLVLQEGIVHQKVFGSPSVPLPDQTQVHVWRLQPILNYCEA